MAKDKPHYVVEKLPQRTVQGNKWAVWNHYKTGSRVIIGFHQTRKGAVLCARLLAGWSGKIEVVE